jgi:NitT/TauT family transport system ATP-binding protein
MQPGTGPPIVALREVCKDFAKASGESLPVLGHINLAIRDGEILGLLGRSGSGKSTLLRIAGGLIRPTAGQVLYRGGPLTGPAEGIAVVFQTFALYPWLTVLENVEMGLDALGLSDAEVRRRALSAIDLIGLDGFQSAYPRELSGGMRQRVGFARALVSDPVLLLLDEPFSALDVLTAQTLQTDFLDLWTGHQLPTRAVLMVTHNIEEAVLMCDRILVLGSNPGHIAAEIPVALPQPRNRLDHAFRDIVDQIYTVLTARLAQRIAVHSQGGGLAQPLLGITTNQLIGFIERLSDVYGGRADLADIAASASLPVKNLFSLAGALHLLELAELTEGAIKLTAAGGVFARSGTEERKQLLKEHLLRFFPLISHICQVLEEREEHEAPRERFELELQDHMNRSDADATLRTAIDLGRFAEIFVYDDSRQAFSLQHA